MLFAKSEVTNEIVPGTVHLVDLEGTLNVKHDDSGQNIILQPQPSSNPNDPLRWPKWKKIAQFSFLWFWAFMEAVTVNWSGPIWTEWTIVFNCTFMDLNISSALCFIFLGIGCLTLQPTAMKMGRRFVYILCTIFAIAGNILGSQATNVQMVYGANILTGYAAAPVDSLVEISTTDVFFQHERARYLSWFILALYAGSDLGPVACGYIVESLSWRWCYYIQIIIFGCILVVQIFYMEDTTFEIREEKDTEEEIIAQIKSRETADLKETHQITSKEHSSETDSDDSSIDPSIPMRPYWKRMQMVETEYNDKRSWFTIFIRPFFLLTFPAVIWGGIVYGAQMMWLSLLATTQSLIFASSPYDFSDASVGLTNLGPLVGSLIGMFYGGPLVDWATIKLARRNNGVLEPEFRLWMMVVPTIFNAAGLVAYGIGSSTGVHWFVPVGLGGFFLGFAMGSSGSICLTYYIDSYPKLASEGMVLMLFIRNCIGCGFTFAIQPWLDRNGLNTTSWLLFMLSIIINGSFIVMIIWGKNFRRWTASAYYKYSDPNYTIF